jgi:hypothetical protein
MPKLSDTAPDAERVLVSVYRRLSIGQKWLQLADAYRTARVFHAAGLLERRPGVGPREILADWLSVQLGFPRVQVSEFPAEVPRMQSTDDLRAVVRVFTRFGIPYALGGSMASSLYGISRYTLDADITVEPFPGQEEAVVSAFGPDWYISLPAVQQAVRNRGSFNIINTSTGFKVDVFVRREEAFEIAALQRRRSLDLPDVPGEPLSLYTPEDIILFKLRWYRLGNESSDQQWSDVLGVLKVQAERLDFAWLEQWAAQLGLSDLLQRARSEPEA